MGFLSKIFSATVKTVLTPVAVLRDVSNVIAGETPNTTKHLIEETGEDISDATDDLVDGEL